MTTSADDDLPIPDDEESEDWEEDVWGDVVVEDVWRNGGYDSVHYYLLQDESFEDAWIYSDESRRLKKMQ